MRYLDDFRDPEISRQLIEAIRQTVTRPWVIMEICGGQTHSIVRNGLDQILPSEIELVHGPGCPVCVTPLAYIDAAIDIATRPGVLFTSYGDMLRVPGSRGSLLTARSEGADIRMVYSPLEALELARENPDKAVVFFSVGFETTAPNGAMAAIQAEREQLDNFSLLVSHVLVPPAIKALLGAPSNRVQGYLLAGHVCAITGWSDYRRIADDFGIPMVVTGFEPVDLLRGILSCVSQLEKGEAHVTNEYARAVREQGNLIARTTVQQVFEVVDRHWRGIGMIANSGLRLRRPYHRFDALRQFDIDVTPVTESGVCISGEILQGLKKPFQCLAFGAQCTPQTPLGATMVSSEGACAAYYAYSQRLNDRKLS
ncbi:hydrogenase formation protein HypD [candidate division GN15 bacterium]|nr:hydrogenase formation protein HypD [candidate division GN15 bacterium]